MPTYDAVKSLFVTIQYKGLAPNGWGGEFWQTGIRLLADTDGVKATDDGRVTPNSFSVQDASASRQTTLWDIEQGWSGVTVGGSSITDTDIDEILDKVADWAIALKGSLGHPFAFDRVKIYPMLAGGGTPFRAGVSATAPITAYARGTSMNPTGGTMLPPDVAAAVSLQTGTRGPSGRGRMFVGSLDVGMLAANGLIPSAKQTLLADTTAGLINGIRAINDGGAGAPFFFTPVIYTRVPNKSGGNADTASVINGVRVSDEFDTQRRRDHQRQDTYTQSTPIV